jgi:hypothetical protein
MKYHQIDRDLFKKIAPNYGSNEEKVAVNSNDIYQLSR